MNYDTGIYAIKNIINGKTYIGSSYLLRRRRKDHFKALEQGTHINPHLQNAVNKHGIKVFKFMVVMTIKNPDNLLYWEQHYIDKLSKGMSYNLCKVAGSSKGRKMTEEHKRKLADAQRGRKHTAESKRKISENNHMNGKTGKAHHLYGTKQSAEAKVKQSEAQMGRIPWNKDKTGLQTAWNKGLKGFLVGREVSEETRKKLSGVRKRQIQEVACVQ